MMPSEPRPESTLPSPESAEQPGRRVDLGRPAYTWYQKLSAALLVIFCMEVGLFLLIFPWTAYWESNYFANLIPQRHFYWDNMYIRGAVSGLGVVNLYIAGLELFRLRRFAGR